MKYEYTELICEECGKIFKKANGQKFCTTKCRRFSVSKRRAAAALEALDSTESRKTSLAAVKRESVPEVKRTVFYIPDIFLVGYGRTQTYQNRCLECGQEFFCIESIRNLSDLFCCDCQDSKKEIPSENISNINYIGNLVGWLSKTASQQLKRSFRNYKKTYERDRYTCQYCGYNMECALKFQPLHIDHIKPWSAYGGNALINLVVSCQECNLIASDKWFTGFEEKKEYILHMKKDRKTKYSEP